MNKSDVEGMAAAVELYQRSVDKREIAALRSLFHSDAMLIGSLFGSYLQLTPGQWIDMLEAEESAPKPKEHVEVGLLDSDGDIGFAKLKSISDGVEVIDYLSFQNFEGKWLITNKSYQFRSIG